MFLKYCSSCLFPYWPSLKMFYALVTVGFQVSNYYWEVSIFPFNSVNVSLFQESAVRCTYVYAWYPLLMNWLINKNAHLLKLFVLQLVFSIIIRAAPAYFWLLFVWNVSLHSLTFFLFVSFGWMVVSYKHHLVESLVFSSIFTISIIHLAGFSSVQSLGHVRLFGTP